MSKKKNINFLRFPHNDYGYNRHVLLFTFLIALGTFAQDSVSFIIDDQKTYQTIEGFGASDAWRCQFVGENWPDEKKSKIAKLLFSKEFDKHGNPEGIGLSMWRFYIGAGSAENGDASGIPNEWRRAESFIDKNGKYDWNKQTGQYWFLKEAKRYGVEKFLAFSLAAPTFWSLNGHGHAAGTGGHFNIEKDKLDDYSDFLATVLEHFAKEGIPFNYLSPVNEPQWDWEKSTQEGTPATNGNISEFTGLLSKNLRERNLSVELVLPEAADLRYLYSTFDKPRRGNQIRTFFNQNSPLDISDLHHVKKTISGHSYFTTWPVDSLIAIRQKLKAKLKENNIGYWQSEFCILEQTDDIGGGRPRDLGMDTALYVARVIHADLTLANASSWQWWTALTNADFKDGLIYLDTGIEDNLYDLQLLKSNGKYHESKLLWGLGNFSLFVRPGMKRIHMQLNDNRPLKEQYIDLMISAFKDNVKNEIVAVAINYSNEDKSLCLSDKNLKFSKSYVTSHDKNLTLVPIQSDEVLIPSRSIVTMIGSSKSQKNIN